MLILLSPAKTLDFSSPDLNKFSTPDFTSDIHSLVSVLQKKSAKDLTKMMSISEKLADLNAERYSTFQKEFTPDNAKQALLAFKGDVYSKIDVDSFSEEDFEFAQKHLRILSGLYGVLKPLDLIQPYRLEMGTKLKTKKGSSLYAYWGSKLAKAIDAAAEGQTIINLASQEYFKAVDTKNLQAPLVHIHFKEYREGNYKVIGLFAKQARGMMANFAIKHKINQPEKLKTFQEGGYEFSEPLSGPQDWVFVR